MFSLLHMQIFSVILLCTKWLLLIDNFHATFQFHWKQPNIPFEREKKAGNVSEEHRIFGGFRQLSLFTQRPPSSCSKLYILT